VHHVGILYDQFMMHGQRNIKLKLKFLACSQQELAEMVILASACLPAFQYVTIRETQNAYS